jgi:hypothetical protein
MSQVIIYSNDDGSLSVVVPFLGSGLTIEQIAAKDVPAGKPYKIIDATDLPEDRSTRSRWMVDETLLTDGVGADYGAGSDNEVTGWREDGTPLLNGELPPVPEPDPVDEIEGVAE